MAAVAVAPAGGVNLPLTATTPYLSATPSQPTTTPTSVGSNLGEDSVSGSLLAAFVLPPSPPTSCSARGVNLPAQEENGLPAPAEGVTAGPLGSSGACGTRGHTMAGAVRVVGLDVTHSCLMTSQQLDYLATCGPVGSFVHSIAQFYLGYHRCVGNSWMGC